MVQRSGYYTFSRSRLAHNQDPIVTGTNPSNLLSEIYGAGRYEAIDELQLDGSVLRRAHGTKMGPMASAWTEDLGE